MHKIREIALCSVMTAFAAGLFVCLAFSCFLESEPPNFPNDWSRSQFYSAPRSSCWRSTRDYYIEAHPHCAFKGCRGKDIEAHHVQTFLEHPERECDPTNLIALCRDGENHHLWVGHQGNFRECNPNVRDDCRHGKYPRRGWLRKQDHDAHVKQGHQTVNRRLPVSVAIDGFSEGG